VVPTRLAELKTCSKPFADIPRIFALSRPTGAKGGRDCWLPEEIPRILPPALLRRRGKLRLLVTFAGSRWGLPGAFREAFATVRRFGRTFR
jgi:hypothetical protein